ncbi:MAG: peptide ABC transporter substrate-binding protein [Gemmatimonadales bacterium]
MRQVRSVGLVFMAAVALSACGEKPPCARCDTLVIAATGEPAAVFPPLVGESVGRDIGDQVYERLADLAPGAAPIDLTAYRPGLAERWERIDSLAWRFHLRPGARWQDGQPVTAADVRFSFEAFADSLLDTAARSYLADIIEVTAEDSTTVVIRFAHPSPEQFYDATYHVRILPAHLWRDVPRDQWGADTTTAHLIGSGPYRVAGWVHGQSLTLVADSSRRPRAQIARIIWRFAEDPDAALNLVLSHEADLMESVGSPDRVARVTADSQFRTVVIPSAAYGFLGYRLGGGSAPARGGASPRAHGIADRGVRRALNMLVDRPTIATAIFGPGTQAPPGPMSHLLWIWDDAIHVLPYDTAAAGHLLDSLGWRRGVDGMRRQGGTTLGFDILVPATSSSRRKLAEVLQETWRQGGVAVTVTAVDFPVFQERLAQRRFDTYIGAWLDEPSPRGLAEQWTAAGRAALNYGDYVSPVFDSLFALAAGTSEVGAARPRWREAMDTLNADAPALFLYNPAQIAAVSRRLQGFAVDPYSWLSALSTWSLTP